MDIPPEEHWINNPLISPESKVYLFDMWELRIREEERELFVNELCADESFQDDVLFVAGGRIKQAEIIKMLDEFIENCDSPEVIDRFEWFKSALIMEKK